MKPVPAVHELGAACQKPRWRETGSPLARLFARPAAVYLTWCALRMRVSPNVVTGVALVVGIGGAALLGTASAYGFVWGVIALHGWYLLDHVDGQVARFCRNETVTGVYFDFMMHHIVHATCAFALGYGAAVRTGELMWTLAGAALAIGTTALALTNDCRYKAFFKAWSEAQPAAAFDSAGQVIVTACKSPRNLDGNDRPSSKWLRPFRAAHRLMLWCCEMPNVLLALTALAIWVVVDSVSGLRVLSVYTLIMSVVAPTLALARLARQVVQASPDREFAHLTRQIDPPKPTAR
jgi:phosphatidylglycerophosphate synthase